MTGHRARTAAKLAMLAGVVLGAISQAARAELSVLDYLNVQQGGDRQRREDLQLYLGGVLEGLLTFNELNTSIDVHVLCIPPAATIDLPTFQKGVDAAIAQSREERTDFSVYAEQANISVMGLVALNKEYPCRQGEDAGNPAGSAKQP